MDPRLNQPIIKAFAVILITVVILLSLLGAGLAAAKWMKAATASLTGFLPMIMEGSPAEAVCSPGALIVFSSTALKDGNGPGRTGMNDVCVSQDASSHFCSLTEIEAAWRDGGVRFQTPFLRSWVDNPYLGTEVTYQITGSWVDSKWKNNFICDGWSTNSVNAEGT